MNQIRQIILLLILAQANSGFSQSAEWVSAAFGYESDISAEAIAIDGDDNIISVGYYKGILEFSDGQRLVGFGTSREIVIQKINASGDILWIKDYNSAGTLEATTVTADNQNNIFISGRFNSSASFDGIPLVSSQSSYNYFIVKIDSDGNTIWAKTIPGISAEKPTIAADSENNIYIVGEFSGTRSFNGTDLSISNGKLYLIKLNSNGQYIYTKQMGSTGSSSNGTLTIDSQDNIIIVGRTLVDAVFGNDSYDTGGGYVVKINSLGEFLWSKQTTDFIGKSLVTDSQNNILFTGSYTGTVQFDDETLSSPNFSSLFVAKLNGSGHKIWLKDIPLNSTPLYFRRPVVTVNAADYLYLVFGFKGELNYEGNTYTATNSNNTSQDIIISSLGNTADSGEVTWSKQFNRIDYTRDKILIAKDNSLYLTSKIRTSDFDGISLQNATPARIIVAKIKNNTLSSDAILATNRSTSLTYNEIQDKYIILLNRQVTKLDVKIFDISGRQIKSIHKKGSVNKVSFDLNGASGIYFLTILTENGYESFKILKK